MEKRHGRPYRLRRDSPTYFPGSKIWGGTHDVPTSGCSQPPVAATIVRDLYEKDPQRGKVRLDALFPRLMRWHRWFHTMRVISGGCAIAVTHPWESGRDNSPDWDAALANVDAAGVTPYTRKDLGHVDAAMRPTNAEYDRYIKLVEYGRECGWDHSQITREGPFAVADPGITFILMRADLGDYQLPRRPRAGGVRLRGKGPSHPPRHPRSHPALRLLRVFRPYDRRRLRRQPLHLDRRHLARLGLADD